MESVELKPAPDDGVLPDGFYVTSNKRTWIILNGEKIEVKNVRMDCCIVVDPVKKEAYSLEPRKVKKGMLVVVGEKGVIEEEPGFRFMTSPVSTERPTYLVIRETAEELINVKRRGGRVFVAAGPAVIHSGGRDALAELVRMGYVDVLVVGNGFAVHDLEASIFGTSLGVSLRDGKYVHHATHVWTINKINSCGSIAKAVELGIVRDGVLYECIKRGVKYIIVGSIRDDGPLKDTITDMVKAQDVIREEIVKGVDLVLVLATMLLGIGICNMLPYHVKVVFVDINPAVIARVYDRGSTQIRGVVTDVGLFLRELVRVLREYNG
ncbi:MAG: TIGR00300 family protein [Thermoprotei archaeon]|mgnify:CR=1 FL=1|nr:MAG: TIGR00300 family protein [Thermoprotei archaeon]